MAAKTNALTKKAGPFPVWAWLVGAVVAFYIFRRFGSGGTSAASASPSSVGTGTNTVPVGTGGGAPASGQGAAIDNLNADLLSQFAGNLTMVNSNLVTGLLGAMSSIEGLGTTALQQNGATEQAIINNWSNLGGGGGNSGGGGASAPTSGGGGGSAPSATATPAHSSASPFGPVGSLIGIDWASSIHAQQGRRTASLVTG